MKKPGKLIVVEGIDDIGKTLYCKCILAELRRQGRRCVYRTFPAYGTRTGQAIRRQLFAHDGARKDPYLTSLLFAVNRIDGSGQLQSLLGGGIDVVCNRYTYSNAFQLAKIRGAERGRLLQWIEFVEFRLLKLPKPDAVFFLDIDPENAARLNLGAVKRKQGRLDSYEKSRRLMASAYAVYRELSRTRRRWHVLAGTKQGKLRSRDEMCEDLVALLRRKGI
jgi:dTMP kinase